MLALTGLPADMAGNLAGLGLGLAGFLGGYLVLLIVLGVIHMATHWRRDRSATLDAGPAWRPILRAAGAVAIAALYVYLMPVLGYRLATMLTLAGMVLYLGKGRSWRAALVGVMGALIVAEVFSRGLNVPLPRGVWMD